MSEDSPAFFRCAVPADAASLAALNELEAEGRIGADHRRIEGQRVIVALSAEEIDLCRAAGIAVEVGEDLRARAARAKASRLAEADGITTGFVTAYLDAAEIAARFAAIHAAHPTLTQWVDLPEATSGYDGSAAGLSGAAPVKMLRITTTPSSLAKPGLLLVTGTHAREWVPPLAAVELAEELLRNYAPSSADPAVQAVNRVVEGLDVFIVPALNPDGINYSHHDDAMWRKNRRPSPPLLGCRGVDLNRNFSIYWGQAGSSGDPCDYQTYRGPAAFSEPENRNVRAIVEQYPNILVAVDCHSFGEQLLRPQPTGGTFISAEPVEPADHAVYLALEAAMNQAVAAVSPGKAYATGTTSNHAGTMDEYLFFGHRIFAFDLETGLEFQPPIAEGLVSVREVAAILRALAAETLDLAARFITPARIAQVVDRSGSMVAFGYAETARADARRMIDLMSLGDAAAVISFNQGASTELGLTPITGPGAYASGRSAVDSITFGGLTSIGAGLAAAASALSSGVGPRSAILLSDGHENSAPLVASVLPTLPADLRCCTIALGPASDQPLLQRVAAATGGMYAFSPSELELHEIYDYVRADATDTDLVFCERFEVPAVEADGGLGIWRSIPVDEDATYATFSVTASHADAELAVMLRSPEGAVTDLGRARRRAGPGYQIVTVRRPQRGTWRLGVRAAREGAPLSCTVAASLRSPLRLRLIAPPRVLAVKDPLRLLVQVVDHEAPVPAFAVSSRISSPAGSLASLVRHAEKARPVGPVDLPEPLRRALSLRDRILHDTRRDPLRHVDKRGPAIAHRRGDERGLAALDGDTRRALAAAVKGPIGGRIEGALLSHALTVDGTHNLFVRVEGLSPRTGHPFVRLGLHSVVVAAGG